MPSYDPRMTADDPARFVAMAKLPAMPLIRGWDAISKAADALGFQMYKDQDGNDRFVDPKTGEDYSSNEVAKIAFEAAGAYSAFGPTAGAGAGGFVSRAAKEARGARPGFGRPEAVMEPPGVPPGVRFPDTTRTLNPEMPPTGRAPLSAVDIRNAGAPMPRASMSPGGFDAGQRASMDAAGEALGQGAWNNMSAGMSGLAGKAVRGAGAVGGLAAGMYSAMPGTEKSRVAPNSAPARASGVDVSLPASGPLPPQPWEQQPGKQPWEYPLIAKPGANPSMGKSARPAPTSASARVAGATAGVGQQHQPVSFSPTQNGSARPEFNYYAEMMNAADAGEGYARDFVNLRENARRSAIEAAQRGDTMQFVPITDYRNNRITLVNAGGNDMVLDMNDPVHKEQYNRMLEKIGMNPNEFSAWSMRASRPLLRHFQPGGGHQDVAPDFARQPGAPQVGRPQMPQAPQEDQPIGMPKTDLSGFAQGRSFRNPIKSMQVPGMEPDADQLGGPSDQDADNMPKPSPSVGDFLRNGASDAEAERRLGAWDYEKEEPRPISFSTRPNANLDPVQDYLGKDLASKRPKFKPKPPIASARK